MINRVLIAAASLAAISLSGGCAQTRPAGRVAAGVAIGTSPMNIAPAAGHPDGSDASMTRARTLVKMPAYAHVVVVVLENHSYDQIVRSSKAPFLADLIHSGAVLTQSYAVTHPSQPNYLALFSGSTQGVTNDSCPHRLTGANLAAALRSHGRSFVGYSESLPSVGYTGCKHGAYARKHSPWANFPALPASVNQPMTAFPQDLSTLPTVAFVIPNLDHDMHDGTIGQSDRWLGKHLGTYSTWARRHNSLLIVTADEDDRRAGNRIATILYGARVRAGSYSARVTHYGVLRTLLEGYHLPLFGAAASARRVTGMWQR